MSEPSFSYPRLLALITLPFYLLDQATKWAVLVNLEYGAERPVIPGFFDLVHWRNTGAAFSMLSDSNRFFMGLSIVALIVMTVLMRLGKFHHRLGRLGCAFLLAGILGNLTDRILHGSVVDFLLFNLHIPYANPWPAFNVADSCIFIAAALWIWEAFQEDARQKKAQNQGAGK